MVDYKSILIKNITSDCRTTLFIYSKYDPLCFLSSSSKILLKGDSHLHRSEDGFKFKIKTKFNKRSKTVVDVRKYIKDTHFTIHNAEGVTETDLEDHAEEKKQCIRKLNVSKEASLDHGQGRDFYEILKLNIGKIRELPKDNQDKEIEIAFRREKLRWDLDIAGKLEDNVMKHEVSFAYNILRNHEKRAEYHNRVDYSKGWLSGSRWRSIFWTEWESKDQQKKYHRRLLMMSVSAAGIAGLLIAIFTAGAAAPVAGICGALGAGCFGGGLQSLFRTIDPKSIEEGCDVKDYLKSFALGFFAGAVAGGVGVGILDGIIGIGSSAIKVSSATVEQWIAVGASSAAVGGVACSLAADAEKKFLDGIAITWKQVVYHALVGAVIGGIVGILVGTVAWAATGWTSEVAATNAEVGLVSGARRFGLSFAKSLVKVITNNSSTALLCGIAGYAEERADDERENRPHSEHLKECAIKLTANAVGDCAVKMLSTTGKHVFNEIQILSNDTTSTKTEKQIQKDRFDYHKKTKLTHTESNVKVTYPQRETQHAHGKHVRYVQTTHHAVGLEHVVGIEHVEVTRARFVYFSKGLWMSKMIIEYTECNGEQKIQTTNSGIAIEIPIEAQNVRVSFKVMRFINIWCDVKKWDRFKKKWYDEPHLFEYENLPEERRYTIDGSLYFEGVINITNERFDDVKDL